MPEPSVTPGQTIGPFFHYALPYDCGATLAPPGAPGVIRLHGTVYDGSGEPVPDALIEIRQADGSGAVPAVEGSWRRHGPFTGWGRAATDSGGRFAFTTVEPGSVEGRAAFFAVTVFARGLLDRLFTRAYLPGAQNPFLSGLDDEARTALCAIRETDGSLRFDIHLQGERETPFLTFPRHRR